MCVQRELRDDGILAAAKQLFIGGRFAASDADGSADEFVLASLLFVSLALVFRRVEGELGFSVGLGGDDACHNVLEHAVDIGARLGAGVKEGESFFELIRQRSSRRRAVGLERQ